MTGYGGGWNPQQDPYGGQQYGPDPHGGQQPYGAGQPYNPGGQPYGADPTGGPPYNPDPGGGQPYGGQQPYGADPYGGQPYGADPYQQYGQGGTAAYPAYQVGYGPPPQPPKSKLPVVLSLIAIVAIVGIVVTIVLLNRDGESPAAASPTSSSANQPTSRSTPPSSRRLPRSSQPAPGGREGWTTVELPGGSYQVPADWRKSGDRRDSGLGVSFAGGAVAGNYPCEGSEYFRGFTASADVQNNDGGQVDLNKAVTDFAKSFAATFYASPKLEESAPKETEVDGRKAATITVKLAVTPTKPACEATSGEVAVLGVLMEQDGKPPAVKLLVVVNDLAGGPAEPAALPDELAEEILSTLTLE